MLRVERLVQVARSQSFQIERDIPVPGLLHSCHNRVSLIDDTDQSLERHFDTCAFFIVTHPNFWEAHSFESELSPFDTGESLYRH